MNWNEIFKTFEQSGKSQAAFCRENKLSYANFNKRYRAKPKSNSQYVTITPSPETEQPIVVRYNHQIELLVPAEQLKAVLHILNQGGSNEAVR